MGFRIVNRYNSPVSVAIMYLHRGCAHQWQAEGWWNINPQGSALVFANDMNVNRYWYYYAHARDGASWQGDMHQYVPNSEFTICIDPASTAGRQYGFRLLDIGNYKNYTLSLSGSGGGQRIDD